MPDDGICAKPPGVSHGPLGLGTGFFQVHEGVRTTQNETPRNAGYSDRSDQKRFGHVSAGAPARIERVPCEPCYRHRKRRMGNPGKPGKPGRDHHNDSTATMCDRNGIACKPLRRNRYVRTLLPQGGLQRDSPCPHLTRLAARGNCCRRRRSAHKWVNNGGLEPQDVGTGVWRLPWVKPLRGSFAALRPFGLPDATT